MQEGGIYWRSLIEWTTRLFLVWSELLCLAPDELPPLGPHCHLGPDGNLPVFTGNTCVFPGARGHYSRSNTSVFTGALGNHWVILVDLV